MVEGFPIESLEPTEGLSAGDFSGALYVATLESGMELRLFEASHIQIVSYVRRWESVIVQAYPEAAVDVLESVTPHIDSAGPEADERYDLYGTVVRTGLYSSLGEDERLQLIDVGEGTVLVSRSELPTVSVGDAVSISTARLELYHDGPLNFRE